MDGHTMPNGDRSRCPMHPPRKCRSLAIEALCDRLSEGSRAALHAVCGAARDNFRACADTIGTAVRCDAIMG